MFVTWGQCYKTFCPLFTDFRTELDCSNRRENLTNDKHSLLRKSVIYGQKSFTKLGPEVTSTLVEYPLARLKPPQVESTHIRLG